MKRPDFNDDAEHPLDEAYARVGSQRQWDAIAEEPAPWWSDLVLTLIVLALGAVAGCALYVSLWGWP